MRTVLEILWHTLQNKHPWATRKQNLKATGQVSMSLERLKHVKVAVWTHQENRHQRLPCPDTVDVNHIHLDNLKIKEEITECVGNSHPNKNETA